MAQKTEAGLVIPKALLEKAKFAAASHKLKLDPALVCAVIEQESRWKPFAVRFEPAFHEKYLVPMHAAFPPTEDMCRAMSFGLMQLMGETARELGFKNEFLTSLCDPDVGLDWGCAHLVRRIASADGDLRQGLQRWNGGKNLNYADEVLARMPRYKAAE